MLQLITAPAVEPISLIEAKLHTKAETTDDDSLISALIVAAREMVEHKTGRALIDQRWEQVLDAFPRSSRDIELGFPPLIAVESVKYTDINGAVQTLSTALYKVNDIAKPARIAPAYNASWPSTRAEDLAVRARFTAGFAAGISAVDAAANTLTHYGVRTLVNDQVLRFTNSGGALPTPLVAGVDYYAKSVAGATFQVAATVGGAAIDLTTTGTGQQYLGEIPATVRQWMLLMICTGFENRAAFEAGQPLQGFAFVDRLLDRYTVARI